jgi:serine/threonine protein kinase
VIMDSTPEEWQWIDLRQYVWGYLILKVDRAVAIAHDVALELGTLHRNGTVRGNFSPSEVQLHRDGTTIRLFPEKVFTGISTQYSAQFAAPEQFKGEAVTPATDIYSLGIAMYQMLTGHVPFDDDSIDEVARKHFEDRPIPPSRINLAIPPALERIILKCLEKVPEMRYSDGLQLASALAAIH